MNPHREVLLAISLAEFDVGWYGIARELGRRGVILDVDLMALLRDLTASGLIVHMEAPKFRHGIYKLTDEGKTFLEDGEAREGYE